MISSLWGCACQQIQKAIIPGGGGSTPKNWLDKWLTLRRSCLLRKQSHPKNCFLVLRTSIGGMS
jgi:hypothetical protein